MHDKLRDLVVVRLMGDWFGDEDVTEEVGDFGPFGLGVILPDVFTDPLGDFFADPLGVEPLVVLNLGTTFWVSVQWTGAAKGCIVVVGAKFKDVTCASAIIVMHFC